MIKNHYRLLYQNDILGDDFEAATIDQQDDYEGKVQCTLIRCKKNSSNFSIATLYIHGFNDYFFQKELAYSIISNGSNFYALELRKYGRSYLSHQQPFNVRSIKEYFEDIHAALDQMYREGHKKILLMGHSTGGLIVSRFAQKKRNSARIDGLILNSPFFEFNEKGIKQKMIPIIAFLARFFPNEKIDLYPKNLYYQSIHQSKKGEWEYDITLKKPYYPLMCMSWISSIYRAQKMIQIGKKIKLPVLLLKSSKSISVNSWSDELYEADAVLNVESMLKSKKTLGSQLTIETIPNAMHDVFLSQKISRDKAYKQLTSWIKQF